MHYFLFVELPGFYVRVWQKRDPDRAEQPLAVHRDKRVIDVNDSARLAGVRLGMGWEEAKALLQGMGLIRFEEEPYRQAQKEWLDVVCRCSSVVEPDQQDSAWADLSPHPDPYSIAVQLRKEVQYETGLSPVMGLAGTKWLSKLSARVLSDMEPALWEIAVREAVENPSRFLEDLPTSLLDPVDPVGRERLKFLGYRTIGQVASIPLRTLKSQFGQEAIKISSSARGRYFQPVQPRYPIDQITSRMCFETGLSNREEIGKAIEALARRLAKELSDREAHGCVVAVRIETEAGFHEVRRTFLNPIRTARQAVSALSRMLDSLTDEVLSLEVRMPELKKASERQAGLFAARSPGDDLAIERAVGRVRIVFGDGSVMRATEKVEPRRVRVLRAWSHATGWK